MSYRSAGSYTDLDQSYSIVRSTEIKESYTPSAPTPSYPSTFGSCTYDSTNQCYYINFFVENGFWNNGKSSTSLSDCIPMYDEDGNTFAYYAYDGYNIFINIMNNTHGVNFVENEWALYVMVYFNDCNAASGNLNVYLYNPVFILSKTTIYTLNYYFYSYYYRPSGNSYNEHNGGTLINLKYANLASWYATGGSCEFYQRASSPGTPMSLGYIPCCSTSGCTNK